MNKIVELSVAETEEVSGGVTLKSLFGFAVYVATYHTIMLSPD